MLSVSHLPEPSHCTLPVRDIFKIVFLLEISNDRLHNPIGVDPGMRLYEFSDDDGTILDYKQYGIR
jgi:hypothetical protein